MTYNWVSSCSLCCLLAVDDLSKASPSPLVPLPSVLPPLSFVSRRPTDQLVEPRRMAISLDSDIKVEQVGLLVG